MDIQTRNQKLSVAKILLASDYYDDTISIIKEFISIDPNISSEERTLLEEGYYKKIQTQRMGIRKVSVSLARQISKHKIEKVQKLEEAKKSIRSKYIEICQEFITYINEEILSKIENPPDRAYYLKLIGDYSRYIAEAGDDENDPNDAKNQSEQSYSTAFDIISDYSSENPEVDVSYLHMQIILNFSTLLHDILDQKETAIQLSQKGLDGNIKITADSLHYNEIVSIQALIRDNLTNWSREDGEVQ